MRSKLASDPAPPLHALPAHSARSARCNAHEKSFWMEMGGGTPSRAAASANLQVPQVVSLLRVGGDVWEDTGLAGSVGGESSERPCGSAGAPEPPVPHFALLHQLAHCRHLRGRRAARARAQRRQRQRRARPGPLPS